MNKIGLKSRSRPKNIVHYLAKNFKRRPKHRSSLNRHQSKSRKTIIPIASIILCSIVTGIFLITQHPLLPPLGFMMFISWRLLRPTLFPMWAGLPFGLIDDIFTSQPFGAGGLLFSLVMLAMVNVDNRTSWRQYGMNWMIGGLFIIIYLSANLMFLGIYQQRADFATIIPQIILAILLFPFMLRLAGALNRYRLSS